MGGRRLGQPVLILALLAFAAWGLGVTEMSSAVDHTKYDKVRQCTRCHPRTNPTHWQQTPEEMQTLLPLDENGRISCTTCHICTRKTCDLSEAKEDLCRACHDCSQGMACLLGVAHLGDSGDLKTASVEACQKCHEAEGAPEVCELGDRTVHTSVFKTKAREGRGTRVSFVDGEITCLSCHNPYSAKEYAKLVKSGGRSRLCTTCHSKLQSYDHNEYENVSQCITCHPRVKPTHTQQKPNFMKARLPLDEEGRMLCTTCHSCVNKTCPIRGDKKQICQVCHDCTRGMSCLIGTPHLGNNPDKQKEMVDACRSCHDTVNAPKACAGNAERMKMTGETCVSCHDPYATDDKTMFSHFRATKEHSVEALGDRATFCPRRYVEISDEEECKRCHPR